MRPSLTEILLSTYMRIEATATVRLQGRGCFELDGSSCVQRGGCRIKHEHL